MRKRRPLKEWPIHIGMLHRPAARNVRNIILDQVVPLLIKHDRSWNRRLQNAVIVLIEENSDQTNSDDIQD